MNDYCNSFRGLQGKILIVRMPGILILVKAADGTNGVKGEKELMNNRTSAIFVATVSLFAWHTYDVHAFL